MQCRKRLAFTLASCCSEPGDSKQSAFPPRALAEHHHHRCLFGCTVSAFSIHSLIAMTVSESDAKREAVTYVGIAVELDRGSLCAKAIYALRHYGRRGDCILLPHDSATTMSTLPIAILGHGRGLTHLLPEFPVLVQRRNTFVLTCVMSNCT